MDSLMPFIDLLQKEDVKVEACETLVKSYINQLNTLEITEILDPVTLNSMNYFCKTMHDTVNAITLGDELRQISDLIVNFLALVYST